MDGSGNPSTPSTEAVRKMLQIADRHFSALVDDGCDEDVARDRTWDAYVHAFENSGDHCFDTRDRAAEAEMRIATERYGQ